MNIISRDDWGAKPGSLPRSPMYLPVDKVFIHHSVTPVTTDVIDDMRFIERVGIKRFGYISYSYVIHPHDGEILEGAGLRRGAHTAQRNSTSFGICWAGNYDERHPKAQQIEATRWLIDHLIQAGHLRPSVSISGHRDVAKTACPGQHLYAVLDSLRAPWTKEDKVPAEYDPPIGPIAAVWRADTGNVIAAASPDGDVYAWGCDWEGNVRGKSYWGDRKVARIGPPQRPGAAYTITATTGETYTLPDGMD